VSGVRSAVGSLAGALGEVSFCSTRYRRMRRIDLLIVAGSNQLSDYVGGPWGFPYTIFAWAAAARLAGTRVVFLSVGAGPIRSSLSRYFIRAALGWAAYRSYRDVGSRDTIQALGVPGPHLLAPDLAHGLRLQAPEAARRDAAGARTVVVNPLPYFDPRFWAESDRAVYERYVDLLAAFAGRLLGRGYRVRLIPTQLRADPPVIADVVRALERLSSALPADRLDPAVSSFEELLARLAEADVVVATRFHGVVLAQMLGKPTIGIAYRRSTTDLLADVGQGAYSIDAGALTLEGLWERLESLESDSGAARRIAERLGAYREALAAQYDLVLGTATGGVRGPAAAA
jgi:polysaccharide pyruvyl transferase WcaK-like protein